MVARQIGPSGRVVGIDTTLSLNQELLAPEAEDESALARSMSTIASPRMHA